MLSFILGIIVGLLIGWWIWGRAAAQGHHGHNHGPDHGHDHTPPAASPALTDAQTARETAEDADAAVTPMMDTGEAIAPTGIPDVGAEAPAEETPPASMAEPAPEPAPSPLVSDPVVPSPAEPGTLTPEAVVGASSGGMDAPGTGQGPLIDDAAQARARAIGITPAEAGAHGDDLKRVRGIGPKLEGMLHDLGVYTFAQMAAWTEDEIDRVNDNLTAFKGRIRRDDWRAQAKELR